MNKRAMGGVYEEHARLHLLSKGYTIVDQNYYTKFGEIDIIAMKDQNYMFVEVKYRSSDQKGKPYEAVGYKKRQHMMKSAVVYIKEFKLYNHTMRFDIIDILGDELTHYENAFPMDLRFYNY